MSSSFAVASASPPPTSSFPLQQQQVYVRDDAYVWLPARLLDINKEEKTAKVQITLPSNWHTSTILCDDSSIEDLEDNLLLSDRAHHTTSVSPLSPRLPVSPTNTSNNSLDQIRTISLLHYDPQQVMNGGDLPRRNVNLNQRDMADLQYLHEPAILYNLKERHAHSQPYTRVGDIVVAMNPYVWLPKLYTAEMRDLYAQALIWSGTCVVIYIYIYISTMCMVCCVGSLLLIHSRANSFYWLSQNKKMTKMVHKDSVVSMTS
jgi:hypothetical protein